MLTTKASKNIPVSKSTLSFVTRFIWNDNNTLKTTKRDQPPENEVLADALNLLIKPSSTTTSKNKQYSYNQKYKPSLYKSLTKGSISEQFNTDNITKFDYKSDKHQHINDMFVNNLIFGLKSSKLDSSKNLNHSALLKLNTNDLSKYIKNVKDEHHLLEITQLFINHSKVNIRFLTDILLNKSVLNLKALPINLESMTPIHGLNSEDMIKLQIILLKKHHDLKHPINVIRNLKSNFNKIYLPLIEQQKLSPFYERIIWRFVFEYLKQFNEEYYIENLNNIKTSFLIWESSTYNHIKQVSSQILQHHTNLNKLQILFLKIAQSNNLPAQISDLKRISMKYKLYNISSSINDENSRKSSYALINDLEKYLVTYSKDNDQFNSLLEELALYRIEYIKDAFTSQFKEFDSLNKILEFNT
ncbi:hypothetical protein KGF54_004234 [Candida jiufengensis]|uniref:uncharacterized protein n=1 Tax=Candida jiufengensis TaxID=497108 RepID=UPI00222507D7|nr:uncharacterized protein KGF54_004234 [Candida jiufengensis]KAI5951160.1 hypothetical protein KGF54_004234 [Candida jiufengensis]